MIIWNLKNGSVVDFIVTIFPKILQLAFITGLLFFISNAQADVIGAPGPTEPSIDCEWEGPTNGFVTCTINEPQGIGSVLIHKVLNGAPWFSLFEYYPECPTTTSFYAHADGPSSLLIDVKPCGSSNKISSYRYIPMETDSPNGKLRVLKVPNEKGITRSVEGLVEENKRLWKFMDHYKRETGVVREN